MDSPRANPASQKRLSIYKYKNRFLCWLNWSVAVSLFMHIQDENKPIIIKKIASAECFIYDKQQDLFRDCYVFIPQSVLGVFSSKVYPVSMISTIFGLPVGKDDILNWNTNIVLYYTPSKNCYIKRVNHPTQSIKFNVKHISFKSMRK